jgi:hypothetical protein
VRNASATTDVADELERRAAGEDLEVWPPYSAAELRALKWPPMAEPMSLRVLRVVIYVAIGLLAVPMMGVVLHLGARLIAWGWRLV